MTARTGRCLALLAVIAIASCDGDTPATVVVPVVVPVPIAVPTPTGDAAPLVDPTPVTPAAAAPTPGPSPASEPGLAPASRTETAVWRLGPNRLLGHRIVDGDLVVDAAAAGFARYTRFGMPVRHWTLRRRIAGRGAAVADGGGALDLPLSRAQASAARHLVLRVHVATRRTRRLTILVNGRRAGRLARVDLRAGWQTVAVPIARRRLQAGENQITLDTGGDDDLALAWLRVAARRTTADPRRAAHYDPAADTFLLRPGAGLAWYVEIPVGAHLVGDVVGGADAGCRIDVAARASDGTVAGGRLGDGSRVDLSTLAGRAVRLTVIAAGCPLTMLRTAAIAIPTGPPVALIDGPPPRYVILWVMDALRADRVRPFQPGARAEVPSFDALASTGVVFRQHYVQGNESQTSHASVWTSTYPAVHNVRLAGVGGSWRLPSKLRVLGEVVAEAGLVPIGVTGNGFVSDSPGYARGFDEFRNMMREKGVRNGVLPGDEVLAHALARLDARRSDPVFLFLGTIDTHSPWIARQPWMERYDPGPYDGPHQRRSNNVSLGIKRGVMGCSRVPEPRDLERLNAIYDSAVSYQDARLGDLMAALDRWGIQDETMIVVTADHGEEWFEDGRCGHGASLRDSLVRVPLLVHYPARFPGGVVVEEGVEGIDVLPTILDALGAAPLPQAQGESLRALAHGHGRGWLRPSYASQYEYAHTMRLGRWKVKLRKSGDPVMLDVIADPLERTDLGARRSIERRLLTDAMGFFLEWRRGWSKRAWGVVTNLEPAGALALGRGGW